MSRIAYVNGRWNLSNYCKPVTPIYTEIIQDNNSHQKDTCLQTEVRTDIKNACGIKRNRHSKCQALFLVPISKNTNTLYQIQTNLIWQVLKQPWRTKDKRTDIQNSIRNIPPDWIRRTMNKQKTKGQQKVCSGSGQMKSSINKKGHIFL